MVRSLEDALDESNYDKLPAVPDDAEIRYQAEYCTLNNNKYLPPFLLKFIGYLWEGEGRGQGDANLRSNCWLGGGGGSVPEPDPPGSEIIWIQGSGSEIINFGSGCFPFSHQT